MPNNLLKLAVAFTILAIAQSSFGQSGEGHVTLANGDRLPARIASISAEEIEFSSPLFLESVQLDSKYVGSFGFRGDSAPQNTDQPIFQFRFQNGDRLIGSLVSIDDKKCVLNVPGFGTVTAPLSQLSQIIRPPVDTNVEVYNPTNWSALSDSIPLNRKGLLELSPNFKQLSLPKSLRKGSRFEIDFLKDPKTGFQIALSNGKNGVLAVIEVSASSLVVEAGDELEFGDLQSSIQWQKLYFDWDGETLQILDSKFERLIKVALQSDSPLAIAINNNAESLQIAELAFATSAGPAINITDAKPGNILKTISGNADVFDSLTVKEGNVTFESSGKKSSSQSLNQVQQIWFDKQADAADSPAKKNDALVAYWVNGQRIHLSEVNWNDKSLQCRSDQLEFASGLKNLLPANVFLAGTKTEVDNLNPSTPSTSPFQLAISGLPLSGDYTWGDSEHPVKWKFFGFQAPVKLDVQREIEIYRTTASATEIAADETDRILLNDGSIVPCQVKTASETNLSFKSSHVQSQQVSLEEMRCCFFSSSNQQWQKLLTKETVQRALVLPRFSRDARFKHILIGRNGDLLRGNLLDIQADRIEFESRQQPLEISRDNVAGIISVIDDENEKQGAEPDKAVDKPNRVVKPGPVVLRIDAGNDFVATGNYVQLNREQVILESPILGQVTVAGDKVQKIAFNTRFSSGSELLKFADWQMSKPLDPRWTEVVESAADANELLNQPAPAFEANLIDDSRSFALSDHRGKVVVLQFWESASRPSVVGLPELRKTIQKFSPQAVAFVAANQGETVSAVEKFLAAEKWSSTNIVIDTTRKLGVLYNVSAIPQTMVIDRAGIVRHISIGYATSSAAELEAEIRKLLAE